MTTIPSGWASIRLGELKPGRNESVDPRKAPGEVFEVYSVPAFPTGKYELLCGAEIGSSKQRVEPGTVLLCGINPRINRVWVVSESQGNQQIASTEWIAFEPIPELISKYVAYFLQQNSIRDYLASNASGVGGSLMRVKGRTCAQIEFPIAPSNEQRRVVQEIENQFTRLDAAIAALRRVRANLKRYRAAVLKAACEGRLVPTESELARHEGRSYESASVVLNRIPVRPDAPPIEDQDDLMDLPEGWTWTTLSKLIADGPQNGLYLPKSKYGRGIPILRIDDFQSHHSRPSSELRQVEASEEEIATYSLQFGDMVINRVNSPSHLGKALFVEERNIPALFESNMMRIRLDGLISTQYVVLYLSSTEGRTRLTSRAKWAVNQASINQQDVSLTLIPMPPTNEQHRIVAEASRQLSILEEIQNQVETDLKLTDRLRQSVLAQAFAGRLTQQDSNDEPASILLDRIRAERNAQPKTRGSTIRGRTKKESLHAS